VLPISQNTTQLEVKYMLIDQNQQMLLRYFAVILSIVGKRPGLCTYLRLYWIDEIQSVRHFIIIIRTISQQRNWKILISKNRDKRTRAEESNSKI